MALLLTFIRILSCVAVIRSFGYSLSVGNSNKKNSSSKPRRRGFPLRRITGDGTPYEFPVKSVPFTQEWTGQNWPFTSYDFSRIDYYNDYIFYTLPRLLYHIDEPAVTALTQYYRDSIEPNSDILDICSSWVSHYPIEFPETMKSVRATGMNPIELFFNDQLTDGFTVADLNKEGTKLSYPDESVDVITCCCSIDYLVDPVQNLKECNRVLRKGGKVILSFSNRCFGTKAIRIWRVNTSDFHVELINAFFKYADGFEIPEAYDITPKIPNSPGYQDPMFVVEAVKK